MHALSILSMRLFIFVSYVWCMHSGHAVDLYLIFLRNRLIINEMNLDNLGSQISRA